MKTVDNSLKGIKKRFGAGITVTDNEIKDIVKVIKSFRKQRCFIKRKLLERLPVKNEDF